MIFHCEFWQKLPNCSHSPQQRVARFVLCFPPLWHYWVHVTLSSPSAQPSTQPWTTHLRPGTAATEQERTIRLFFFSNWRGAAPRGVPVATPVLQRAPAGVAQPLLCPSSSPPNRKNFLSMLYLMAEISSCLQTPWLLPDLQLWSLTNYYSAGNFRESNREQRGYRTNNKNADGENIIMNNIRLALNSELVSPQPIKSPLPCAAFWDVRHAV